MSDVFSSRITSKRFRPTDFAQCFRVVLFTFLYKVVLTFESGYEILWCDNPRERYWAVLCRGAMLDKVVVNFESVAEILKCYHSNESYWAVLSRGAVYYAGQGGCNFWVCGWNPNVWPFTWKLLKSTFLWYSLVLCQFVLTFESLHENPKVCHLNKTYWAVLSSVAVNLAVWGGPSL